MKQSKSKIILLLSLCLVLSLGISTAGQEEETIAFVQHSLNCLGYPYITVDGTYNAKTKSAIKKYQKDNDLKANGKANEKVLSSLNASLQASLASSKLRVHVLDMGEGEAILLESKGEYVLYDGGPAANTSKLITYLTNEEVEGIKYLICSHYDEEHLGGALAALYVFDVQKVFAPLYAPDTFLATSLSTALDRKGLTLKNPKVGKTYSFGRASFTILSPQEAEYEDVNDSCIGLQVECNESTLLLTGDAGDVGEQEMAKTFGQDLKSDLWILSSPGGSETLFHEAEPETVVLTYGSSEKPTKALKKQLKEKGAALYRTDKQGDLLFWVGKQGWYSFTPPYKDYSTDAPENTPTPTQAPQTAESEGTPPASTEDASASASDHAPGDYSWVLGPDYEILAYDEGIGHTYINPEGRTYNPILGELGWFQGFNSQGMAIIRPEATVAPEADIPPASVGTQTALPTQAVITPASVSTQTTEGDYTGNTGETYTYVVNKSTRIFHYSTCSAVADIPVSDKRKIFGTRRELIGQGFTPCEQCNP